MNDEMKLPDCEAMPIAPAGGYGATICAHSDAGVDTTPLAVRPGDQHPELVGQLHQLGLEALALLPRLAVAGRREERGADALLGAGAEQVGVGRRGGAHEDEVDGVVGQVVDVGRPPGRPSTSPGSRLQPWTAPW